MSGYHITEITKGQLGDLSKIVEEMEEVLDADKQFNKLLVLIELSDMVGAISAYLKNKHPSLTIHDLIEMSKATERAFECGERT